MTSVDVLTGDARWSVEGGDCLDWLRSLPDDSIDLIVTSPPYVDARSYGIDFSLTGEDWVRWMVEVITECARVCKGLVACVCEGRTEGFRYDGTPLLLAADLHRAGLNLRKPAAYFRYGIPGSGRSDWWRNDWEPIICVTRPGRLPWSDVSAAGHAPKYSQGGEMSHQIVLSFCPPGGVVADPFTGSGTTGAVSLRLGRRFVGCDVRESQVALASERLRRETPGLPGLEG